MPASDLKNDVKANVEELRRLAADVTEGGPTINHGLAIVTHLQNTLWPFLDGLCDDLRVHEEALETADEIIEELSDAVDELTEERGTVLMPEEAGVFATVILMGREIAQLVQKGQTVSPEKLNGLLIACDAGEKVIQECTINPEIEADGDDDDDDEGDDE